MEPMKRCDPTAAKRLKAYRERQKAAGLVSVRVVVPAEKAADVRAFAAQVAGKS